MPITSDKEAKAALRAWPGVGKRLWPPSVTGARWLRAHPVFGNGPAPRLYRAGSNSFSTQPDGMYVCLAPEPAHLFADVIVIEASGSGQNFFDKRSRYMSSIVSLGLWCDIKWLLGTQATAGGGQRTRWELAGTFKQKPTEGLWLTVRFLRALYFLKDALFDSWTKEGVPEGHEFVSRYSSLPTYQSQPMQKFLRGMALSQHFYPKVK